MISKLLLNPGDTVLTEEYCYQGAINRFRKLGAELVGMRLDGDGIVIEALAEQLADLKERRDHAQVHLHHSDDPESNRQHPAARPAPRAAQRWLGNTMSPIFEDECYADLLWDGIEAPPALYALDPGCVIHIGSFSKSLAPALRLGYLISQAGTS